LKVINTGQVDILQSFYDENEDWGFKISSGEIIEIRPTKTNSDYLKNNINPLQMKNDFIKLGKIILEKDKYVSFEILVLHKKNSPPRVVPVGKIAGIDNFFVTDSISDNKENSFLNDLFYGKLHTHILRAILYFISFMFIAVLGVGIAAFISSSREKLANNKRKKKLERMGLSLSNNNLKSLDTIYNAYTVGRFQFLIKLNHLLKSKEELLNKIEKIKIQKKYKQEIEKFHSYKHIYENHVGLPYPSSSKEYTIHDAILYEKNGRLIFNQELDDIIYELLENNTIIVKDDDNVNINKEFQDALNIIIAVIS